MFWLQIERELENDAASVNLQDSDYIKKAIDKMPDVGRKMEYLLNTGNLISRSGLDLSQATGYTVVAEKLNFFRSHTTLSSASPKWLQKHMRSGFKFLGFMTYISVDCLDRLQSTFGQAILR